MLTPVGLQRVSLTLVGRWAWAGPVVGDLGAGRVRASWASVGAWVRALQARVLRWRPLVERERALECLVAA